MFSFFKKQPVGPPANPLLNTFADTSIEQKQSVTNLLLCICTSEGIAMNDAEFELLSMTSVALGVDAEKGMKYLNQYKITRLVSDLKRLADFQKEALISFADNMLSLAPAHSVKRLPMVVALFEQIGISEERYLATVTRNRASYKYM